MCQNVDSMCDALQKKVSRCIIDSLVWDRFNRNNKIRMSEGAPFMSLSNSKERGLLTHPSSRDIYKESRSISETQRMCCYTLNSKD